MIYLSGSINLCSQADLEREAEFFATNHWELKDPTTHRVAVTVDESDIDALAQFLRNKPRDRKPKVWTDRNGEQHQAQTVTFFLNGTEMTGNWTRLRARLDPDGQSNLPQTGSAPTRQGRAAAPIRRSSTAPSQLDGFTQPAPSATGPSAAMAQPSSVSNDHRNWNQDEDDDDVPF